MKAKKHNNCMPTTQGRRGILGRLLLTAMLFFSFSVVAVNAQSEHVFGEDATSSSYSYSPYGGFYGFEYYVYLYDAADVDFTGTVTAVSFKSNGASEANETANYTLWMKDVPSGTTLDENTTFATYNAGSTQVFASNTMPALADGWNTTTLTGSFVHQQGHSILVMARGVACSPSGGCRKDVYYKNKQNHVWYKRKDDEDPGTESTGYLFYYLPSIKFTYTPDANFCPTPTGLTISNQSESGATVSWTSQESSFIFEYKAAAATTWTSVNNINAKSYTLNSLSSSTTYNVRVKAKRGTAESVWLEGSFTTTSVPTVVGNSWSDDFESSCNWELVYGTLTNKWVWGTATKNGGSKALYISNDGGATNAYTNNSNAMVYATKLLSFTEGKHIFSYNWKAKGESTYDYLRVALVPASVVLTAGTNAPSGFTATTLPTGWIALDGGSKLNLVDDWQVKDVTIDVPTGNYYLVFAWSNDNSYGSNPPAAIDNVSVTRMACLSEVTNLAISNLTTNSAALTWTATVDASQWQVAYSTKANFEGATEETVSSIPYTITGLQPNTHYFARVRANCSGSNYGVWSEVKQFTTDCGAITQYPWTENFDSYTAASGFLPDCWRRINSNTTTYSHYPYVINFSANSSSNCLYFNSYAYYSNGTTTYDPQNQYAILPPMENLGGKLLKFYAKGYSAKNTFKIGVMTDPTDVSTFTEIDPKQALTTTYEEFAVIIPEQAQGTYVAFMIEGASEERNTNCVYIDDIVIDVAPTCTKPAGLKCTVTTVNSATLDWTENGNATEWQICIDGDETHLVSANSNPFSVTGLNAGTAYTAKVRSVKGNEHSEWSKEVSFDTKCADITIFPWSENFEGYSSGDFNALCWVNEHISGGGTKLFQVYTISNGDNSTHQLCLPDQTKDTKTKLVLPGMTLPSNKYKFVLDVYRNDSYSSYSTEGVRVYASSNGNIDGATELAFIPRVYSVSNNVIPAETAKGWYTYELPIPMSGTCYIILQGESQYGADTYMDNFIVKEINNFPKPTGLTFNDISSKSVTLSWTEKGTATAWQICLNDDETNLIPATTNPFTINGLTPSTAYTVKVRACGENVHSEWSKTVSFQTDCGIMTLPYYCGFENAGDLKCWTKSDCHQYTDINSSAHHSGNNAFKFYFTNYPPQYLISPELDGTSDITVAFYYYKPQSTSWKETFQVGYSSATTNPKDFVWGNEITASNVDNWELYEEVFPEGTKYVAIKHTSNDQYYLYIDDFSILPNYDNKEYSITTDGVVNAFVTTYNANEDRHYSNVVDKARRGQVVTLSWDGEMVPAGQYVSGFNITKAHGGTVTATQGEGTEDYTFIMPGDNVTVQTLLAPQEEYVIQLETDNAIQVVPETLAGMLTQCEGYVNNTIDFDGNGNADVQLTEPTDDKNSTDPYANDYTVRRLAGANNVTMNYSFNFVSPFPYRYNRVLFKLGKESNISNITLNDGISNEGTLNEYNGQTANVTLMRTLYKDGDWNTLCLPFNVTIAGSQLDGNGVEARQLTSASITGKTLTLIFNDPTNDPVTVLSAGVPYIIKWTKPDNYVAYDGGDPSTAYDIVDPKFSGVIINKQLKPYDNGVTGDGRVRFIGIYKPIEFKTEDKSILFFGASNSLYYPTPVFNEPPGQDPFWSYPSISAFRAYFKIGEDDTNQARTINSFVINLGEEQDGINEVVELYGMDDSRWYDLNGRQLNGRPTQRGVYLNNHRKVVIK